MSEWLNTSQKYISKLLEHIIGTEDFTSCARANVDVITVVFNGGQYRLCVVGSRADGLYFDQRADIDFIYIIQDHHVVIGNVMNAYSQLGTYIRAIFPPETSGYALLELITSSSDFSTLKALSKSTIYYKNGIFFSSSNFLKNFNQEMGFSGQVSGPSCVMADSDTDNVFCLKCDTWPIVADEWIQRNRRFSWPRLEVIRLIVSNGCMFVPIGEYNSPHKFLEWRISFAVSENALVRTFNTLQFKLYGLMKLINRDICSNYKNAVLNENIITSYHIKTIMFWVIEQTPETLWVEKHLMVCLRMCLLFLKNCLKGKFLPHYFLPKCNLFKKNRACDLGKLIEDLHFYSQNVLSLLMKINLIKECFAEYSLMQGSLHDFVLNPRFNMFNFAQATMKMVMYSGLMPMEPCETIHMCYILVANINKFTTCEYLIRYKLLIHTGWNRTTDDRVRRNNKSNYIERRKYKNISLWGTHIDLTTGWLKLASYHYVIEQYNSAEQLLMTAVRSSSCADIFLTHNMQHNFGDLEFIMKFVSKSLSFNRDVINSISGLVPFYQHDMYPHELDIEINSAKHPLFIKPLQYAYFLVFLCSYNCHGVSQQLDALLHDFELVVCDTFLDDDTTDTTLIQLNMLGICYQLIGDVGKASYYYEQSMKEKHSPFTEGTQFRLQSLEKQTDLQ